MLKRLKALEGEMGLVESEEEEGGDTSGDNSSCQDKEKKRKRDKSEKDRGRKKWKGPETRPCNLYLQGKCPREENECLFSHDVELPQVWELCKFYVYDRCVKKDKCLYLHKGFPCKFYHLGMDCQNDANSCKFSHDPLNETTRSLLLKHVESAPKELLGDFPRLTRQEATRAVWNTAAKNSGWTLPDNNTKTKPGTRWDRSMDISSMPSSLPIDGMSSDVNNFPGMQGREMLNIGAYTSQNNWRGGSKNHGSSPKCKSGKPTGLMDLKLNEEVIKQFLSNQERESDEELSGESSRGRFNETDSWNRNAGDETPEITPPVSPSSGSIHVNEASLSSTQHEMYQGEKQIENDLNIETSQLSDHCQNDYYSESEEHLMKDVKNNIKMRDDPTTLLKEVPKEISILGEKTESQLSENTFTKKGEKKDPRLHKIDPRKERQAKRDEEERLEKEKDKRILELDLGSVFGDLELPPLTQSPKQTEEERYISDKFGLPFKPYIFHVAKEIEASVHSHSPIEWILIPVDVPERDYTLAKQHSSSSQLELDPRLRKNSKSSNLKIKDLPLPNVSSPKIDPRLKGKMDPRRNAHSDARRRSSEDSEGNLVYNPARELNKERTLAQTVHKTEKRNVPLNQTSPSNNYNDVTSKRGDQYRDDHLQKQNEHFNQNIDGYNTEDQAPYDISKNEYNASSDEQCSAGRNQYSAFLEPLSQEETAMNFGSNKDLPYQQMQFSMGLLKGIQHNMEAILNKEVGPRMSNYQDDRSRFDQSLRFPGGGGGQLRGFSSTQTAANRGQWVPRFGRGDIRGRPDFNRPNRGNSTSNSRIKDPRIKY